MLKKVFILFISLIITAGITYARGFDFNFPLHGDSIASDDLQFKILKKIYKNAASNYPACFDIKISDTQIVHYPYDVIKKDGKFVSGYWKEIWTVKACDEFYQVPITFYIRKKGTYFDIDM